MSEEKAAANPAPERCVCMGAGPAFTRLIEQLAPNEEVREHFRNARVEFLKGIRQLIDQRIDRISHPQPKGASIPVE